MLKIFIERPVLSTVISVILVLLGVLGLTTLPIAQYPDISPPTVQVSASYAGANADVVLKSVLTPLEEQINGVEGMTYMTSTATNAGAATIQVYFNVGRDPDQAAVDVQNRVASATSLLPQEVTLAGVTVRKQQSSNLLIFALYSDNPAYDQTFLQNYAQINITPQIRRVTGVGASNAFGSRDYSMRVWLKPDVMAIYGLTPSDVTAALADQNVEAAPGAFGQNSDQSFQYVIKYTGKLVSAEQFGNIVLKGTAQGQLLRLKDVARIELGAQDYSSNSATFGKPSVGISVNQTPGSNAREVIENSVKVLETAAKSFPAGIHYVPLVNINDFLDASIDKVIHTLIEAFALVFLVIFIFLQDFRSTIIHGVSVPVSIIGTFFFLKVFGYSINILTLFALVLAIGIVVDDAIVVVEAVHAKLENGYSSPRRAAIDAMSEISGAIVSITLVMAAVFLPVTFLEGSTGVFYKQFGITLAIAIMISAVNALTLCPALAALFLLPPDHGNEQPAGDQGSAGELGPDDAKDNKKSEKKTFRQRFSIAFNAAYDALVAKYTKGVEFLGAHKVVALAGVAAFSAGLYFLMSTTPSSFVPAEDMGTIFVNVSLPPASALERTTAVNTEVDSLIRTIPAVRGTLRITGQNFLAGAGSSYGMVIVRLKEWSERPDMNNTQVIDQITKLTSHIRAAEIRSISQPTITGFGATSGFTFQLQDRGGHSTQEFYQVAQDFLAALNQRPEIQYATTAFNPGFPQYQLAVNVAKVKEAGLTEANVLNAMQVYYGGLYSTNFNQFGKQYRVMVQADTSYRASPEGLSKIFVRNASGTMAPITEFVTLTRIYGPESLNRFNLFTAISVNGSPKEGVSSGQALIAIQEVASQKLPAGYGFEFSGLSREEQKVGGQALYVFALSLIFVYLLLSAQYESYLLPFAVLLSIPIGLCGTYLFAKVMGIDSNIYLQISIIMLIGLLAKNAILIVEFASLRRLHGLGIAEAALEGAKARLRPILMTSLAFVAGLLPLLFASGAGAQGNRSIGTGAVGGMLFGTLIGVFFIPVLYIIFEGLQERISGPPKTREQIDKENEEGGPKDPKKTDEPKEHRAEPVVELANDHA
ncbi:efflux RND transporter permease subunit [Hymenobacter sp. BT559]|jgi:HAE1 family hydrophobic/amphiphilic exporter-1|uniref:efflux RND transporter permease subunit n=1 Tax=Hymenobacter sp. BT559 TaxID=2795729 RepID=UPI0018EDEE0F|nr:efflux RND transporter permease subunit [Hymenobacter sp. BT559]MBJ6144719.1 efflux RND transporter permease subunit [Hymenobacter sp. BT559]